MGEPIQNDKLNITSLLAKEIATEVAQILKRDSLGRETADDPKGLRGVRPELLNIEQTAKYLGRTVKGVRDLEKKGVITPIRFDRKIQFSRRHLDEVIQLRAA